MELNFVSWESVLLLGLGIWSLTQIVLKSIVHNLPKAKALSLQFLIAAIIVWGYNLAIGDIRFDLAFLPIAGIGFINAFGAYCQWRAYRYSLSKTGLFLPISALIAMALAAVFLGEARIYSAGLATGAALTIFSAILLKHSPKKEEKRLGLKWLGFIIGMVAIVGLATFMMKSFTISKIPINIFMLYWYSSSFLGSLPMLWLERKDKAKLFQPGVWRVPLASLGIIGVLGTIYWTLQLTPLGIVEPIRSFGSALLPILLGWFIFKERKGLTKLELAGFVLGIIGVSIIILGMK